MQFYLISDNVDTRIGMRLSGIDGVVVHDKESVIKELENASDNDEIAVVLLTNKIVEMAYDYVYDFKLKCKKPLIVEIPDRHATADITNSISKYLKESIGISI